jgi:hypothetical protein
MLVMPASTTRSLSLLSGAAIGALFGVPSSSAPFTVIETS